MQLTFPKTFLEFIRHQHRFTVWLMVGLSLPLAAGNCEPALGQQPVTLKCHDQYIDTVGVSPDGRTIASGGTILYSVAGSVRLWDVATHRERTMVAGHDKSVRIVAFSPDGRTLASAGEDLLVKLWNLDSSPVPPKTR